MSDILSGGIIDGSTSGPIPSNMDGRRRDIIAEQKETQRQNAIGGTEEPPTPIAPSLPILPSFGSLSEEATEAARRATIDVLKNVTINGQGPSIEGSSISFNVSQEKRASEILIKPTYERLIEEKEITIQPAYGRLTEEKEATIQSAYGRLTDLDPEDGYKAAEKRSREKKESDPDFDRASDVRQKGETLSEYKERQKSLESPDVLDNESVLTRDISGPIAVLLQRADGNGQVFAFFRTENSTDGGPTLPESEYYVGGGGKGCVGLALYTKTVGTGDSASTQVWIGAGTVAGKLPSDFDPSEGKSISSGGSGYVWAKVEIDEITGEITSVEVSSGGSTPQETNTSFYHTLGYYEYDGTSPSIANYGCGSVEVSVCRNWFTDEPPFYGVGWSRS
jgi:hypothetical protein